MATPLVPVTLLGSYVRLEPLTRAHCEPLGQVALDPAIWRWTLRALNTVQDVERYIDLALDLQAAGVTLPFATVAVSDNRVVGSTRFQHIECAHRRLEIGDTWVAPPWQRTAINTEAKYLMLQYAFEILHYQRVEFRTDALNARSRAAIRRIGATEEGCLRRQAITDTGRVRDTMCYSILDVEWPEVKSTLAYKLGIRETR